MRVAVIVHLEAHKTDRTLCAALFTLTSENNKLYFIR